MISRILKLLACILVLLAITYSMNKKQDASTAAPTNQQSSDTATVVTNDNGIVINSTNIAGDVKGYAGPVPLKVYISNNIIDSIVSLQNTETPSFYSRASEGVIQAYIGKSVDEAKLLKVDAVSGATMSSNALKTTISRCIALAPSATANDSTSEDNILSLKLILAILVSLAAAIIPLFVRNKVYRTIQLSLNVAILGLYAGCFVSYSSIVGLLSHGFSWSMIAVGILLIVAFLYPLFGKKSYYCNWCCPLGSAQELLGKTRKKKLSIPPKTLKALNIFRKALWCILMLLAWSGILLEWMDYELFSAFIWASASWIVIAFTIVVLLLSIFVNRPYCRFVCPTGTILKWL